MASNFRSFQQLLILALMLQNFNTQFSSANRLLLDEKKPIMKPAAVPILPIPLTPEPNFPILVTAPFLQFSPSDTPNSPMLPSLPPMTVPGPSSKQSDIITHPILPPLPPLPQLPPLPTLPLIPSIPSAMPSFPFGPGSSDTSALVRAVSEDNGKTTP